MVHPSFIFGHRDLETVLRLTLFEELLSTSPSFALVHVSTVAELSMHTLFSCLNCCVELHKPFFIQFNSLAIATTVIFRPRSKIAFTILAFVSLKSEACLPDLGRLAIFERPHLSCSYQFDIKPIERNRRILHTFTADWVDYKCARFHLPADSIDRHKTFVKPFGLFLCERRKQFSVWKQMLK